MGHQCFSHSHEFRRWFCLLQLWDLRQAQLLSACFPHLEDVVAFVIISINFTSCIPRLDENETKWHAESPWQRSTHWEHSRNVYWSYDAFVQFSSVASDSVTPWTAASQASLSITSSRSLLKFMPIKSVTPPNHLILCRPLLLLPSVFPSESVLCIRWPKYWSFSFSISPSNEYSGFISFRMDWFDLLAVQGTLKSSASQFKSISSLVLIFLYSPNLTSIHDYWKNHSFD